MNINYIDPYFTDVYDISIKSGKTFTIGQSDQEQLYVLLNERAVKEIRWEDDAIGKKIFWSVDYRTRFDKVAIVAGLLNNYHYLTKHHSISPMTMPLLNKGSIGSIISVKLKLEDSKETLKFIEQNFKEIYADELWNYQFADQIIQNQYEAESKMS